MGMKALKGIVKNGRLRVDEPSKFPEGTEFDLTIADPGDELDSREQAALLAALAEAWASARTGEMHPAQEILERLRHSE